MKSGFIAIAIIIVSSLVIGCGEKRPTPLHGRSYTGLLFGQPYFIDAVGDSTNYTYQIDSIIAAFEGAFSLNDPKSVLSQYNSFLRTDTVFAFYDSTGVFGIVYDMARDFNRQTMQFFDPTTNPLKRAWMVSNMSGLGEPNLDSLYEFVGFDGAKMDLTEATEGDYQYKMSELRKADVRLEADFTDLAAAVALDHIADFLKQKRTPQYRLKQGRNLITRGLAIDSLNIISMGVANDTQDQMLRVVNRAFTYKVAADKAKMIDVTYGYPIINEMAYVGVSSSTLAESVVFSEALMIMGLQKAGEYYTANETSDVQSFLFYQEGDIMKSASTEGFDAMIVIADSIN